MEEKLIRERIREMMEEPTLLSEEGKENFQAMLDGKKPLPGHVSELNRSAIS